MILSHDHYDHLDWGVDASKVREHDWWQETELDGVRFVATPAQPTSPDGSGRLRQAMGRAWWRELHQAAPVYSAHEHRRGGAHASGNTGTGVGLDA